MELKNYILSPIFSNVCFKHSFVTVSNSNNFFVLANPFQTCLKMPENTILVCTSYFFSQNDVLSSHLSQKRQQIGQGFA